ncbi:MAG: hypothetical protein IJW32_02800 [Clostridia bacterium]|nr:hypothetical protein [Clostridia bacterium]
MANKKPETKDERNNLINAILNKGTTEESTTPANEDANIATNTGDEKTYTPVYLTGVFDAMHGPHYPQPKNLELMSAEEFMNWLKEMASKNLSAEQDTAKTSLLREKIDLPELPVDTFSGESEILPPSEVLEKMSACITGPNPPATPVTPEE